MARSKGHIPIRTCISCKVKRPKNELIRLRLDEKGMLLIDLTFRKPGRGAYVCDVQACQEALLNNKRLGKYFRTDKVLQVTSTSGSDC